MSKDCESRRVVGIPIVVDPVVVPVPRRTVPVEVPDVQVAVSVAVVYLSRHPEHCP